MQVNSISALNTNVLPTISTNTTSPLPTWKVFKPIITESLSAIALNLGVITFFATPVTIPLLTASVVTSLAISCLFAWRDTCRQSQTSHQQLPLHWNMTQNLAKGAIVNAVGLSRPNILIHESGHFWAAKALFKKCNPKIWVRPFQGGTTSYTASNRLTVIGKLFGKHTSMMIVAAAGLAASILFACGEIAVAHKIKVERPNISQYLNMHAITHLFNEVIYGMTAFWASKQDLGHDFVHLWCGCGLHPAIPIITMIALPLIQACLLRKWTSKTD